VKCSPFGGLSQRIKYEKQLEATVKKKYKSRGVAVYGLNGLVREPPSSRPPNCVRRLYCFFVRIRFHLESAQAACKYSGRRERTLISVTKIPGLHAAS
jgi:hypothetical protein